MFLLSFFSNLLLIFVLNLICPIIMIVIGYYIKKNHSGYNSFICKKSKINWDFGQKIAPVVFISNGLELILIELALSAILVLTSVTFKNSIIVGNGVGACFFFLAFIMTDTEIVKNAQG